MKTLKLTLIFTLISAASFAGILTVDNHPGSGANYASIGSAINNASNGDTIYIHPSGFSYGSFSLNKQLVFIGPGHHPEYAGGYGAEIETLTLQNGSSGSKFIGLIFGTIKCALWNQVNNIEITNNYFYSHTAISGAYGDNSDGDNWLIQGNVIIQKESCGGCILLNVNTGSVNNPNTNWIFRNNFIQSKSSTGTTNIFKYLNSTITIENNIIVHRNPNPVFTENYITGGEFRNNIFWAINANFTKLDSNAVNILFSNNLTYHSNGSLAILPGTNNIDNTDPQFENIPAGNPIWDYANNYMLSAASAGAGAGTDGTDIGIYGSYYPFRMEGYPQDFPRFKSISVSNTIVPQGQTVQVQLKAVRAGL